ncbi:MAG: LysE family translocator [Chloroflexota bacterium]
MLSAFEILIRGIILGLIVSVPLGPIGIILINRTIKRGVMSGVFSGLGLGVADVLQAIIAALGLTLIIGFIREQRSMLSFTAGIVIIAAGVKVFFSNPIRDLRKRDQAGKSLWRDFYTVFILSITNPYTILIFVAFFSGFPVKADIRPGMIPFILIPGIFIGTMAWWTTLSWVVSRFRERIRLKVLFRINRFAGIIIAGIGIAVIISIFSA